MENHNANHAELRDGEVFIGNMTESRFNGLPLTTKRRGEGPCQTAQGNALTTAPPDLRPCFAQRREVEEKMPHFAADLAAHGLMP